MSIIQGSQDGLILEGVEWSHGTFTVAEKQTSAITVTHGIADPEFFFAFNITPDPGNGYWLRASVGPDAGQSASLTITESGMTTQGSSGSSTYRTELSPYTVQFNGSSSYGLSPGRYYWICVAKPEED